MQAEGTAPANDYPQTLKLNGAPARVSDMGGLCPPLCFSLFQSRGVCPVPFPIICLRDSYRLVKGSQLKRSCAPSLTLT